MPARTATRRKSPSKPKKSKSNVKRNFKYTKILVFVLLFIASFGVLGSYVGYKILNQQFASAESVSSYASTDEAFLPVTYVVVNKFSSDPVIIEKATLKLIDKEGKKILNYNIPTNYVMDAPGKFGSDEFGKFFALGSLAQHDSVKGGIDGVNESIFKLFALQPRKYVYVESSYSQYFDEFWRTGKLLSLVNKDVIPALNHSIYTNFNLTEFRTLGDFIKGLPEDRILDNQISADTDDTIREINIESTFAHSTQTVAVLNGSGKQGVASFGARVVRNLGGRVIAISNSDIDLANSMIISDSPESFNVQTLQYIFKIKQVVSKEQARSMITDNEVDRADIIVIFGFDNADSW